MSEETYSEYIKLLYQLYEYKSPKLEHPESAETTLGILLLVCCSQLLVGGLLIALCYILMP